MKKRNTVIYGLMLVTVAVTGIMLQFMPDVIPCHYNAAGEIDRLGSKYESLIFPAVTSVMGFFFIFMDRAVQKHAKDEEKRLGEKVLQIAAVVTLLLFLAMSIYFMSKAIAYGRSGAAAVPGTDAENTVRIAVILTGAALTVLGNYMPKSRKNAVFGLRTGWSMKNDRVWQKSQRFAGIASVVCGLLLILLGIFVKEKLLLLMLPLLLLWAAAGVAASYVYCRRDAAGQYRD